ncbi:MAG: Flp pilus assembly protein CpaB, partial [Verrucomicrobiia bacterium]
YSAVLASDKPLLAGQIVANNLASGQPLLWTDIQLVTSEALSQRLAADERAITIPIDPVSGVSGFIRPGDRVDILSTTSLPDPKTGRPTAVTRMLLQNVTVLAVGTSTASPTTVGAADPASGSPAAPPVSRTAQPIAPPPARNVTLKVSPEEAAIITFAEQRGDLRLLLRSRVDVVVRDIPDVNADRLLQFNDVDASRSRQRVEGYPTIVEGTGETQSGFTSGPAVPPVGITPADAAARMQEAQRMREQLIRQLQQGTGPSAPDLRNLPPDVRDKFIEGVGQQPRGPANR